MRLLCISDLHGDFLSLRQILGRVKLPDFVILAGDLTHFGSPDEALALAEMAARVACALVVAGNCDSAEIDQRLSKSKMGLHGRGRTIESVGFHGVSAMPRWQGGMYELTEEEIAAALLAGRESLPADVLATAVISHTPPLDCAVDRTRRGKHAGSRAVREYVEKFEPRLVICGHIHEGRGLAKIGETTVVNCGPMYHGCYAEIDWPDPERAPNVRFSSLREQIGGTTR